MIDVQHATKRFANVLALDDVSFTVPAGAIFGLIGPNGAGKTTCLNILSTLLKADGGTVVIAGRDATGTDLQAVRRSIGYMPDFFGVYQHLSTWEYLDFYAGAYGLDRHRRQRRIDAVLALSRLEDKRHDQVDNLSRGMKQRLCLAKALIHEPAILLLDEPASGLDPNGRADIRRILLEAARNRVTIVISSHVLRDLEDICTHVAILECGRLRQCAPLEEVLQKRSPRPTWRLRLAGEAAAAAALLEAQPLVGRADVHGQFVLVELDETQLANAQLTSNAFPAPLTQVLNEAGIALVELGRERQSLEEAFLALTDGTLA